MADYSIFVRYGITKRLDIRLRFLAAIMRQQEEFETDGRWHVDICACDDCNAIRDYLALSKWEKFRAWLDEWMFVG